MSENKPTKSKGPQGWSTRAGTIKPGSIEKIAAKEGKDGLRAIVVNKENAEHVVEAYGDKNMEKLQKAADSGASFVFRGPMYMKAGASHLMINHVVEQGAPSAKAEKPELSDEEKAAQAAERSAQAAERKALRDASRVLVEAGSVEIGGKVEKEGVSQEINHIGAAFDQDGKSMAYAYFGELGAEMAARAAEAEAQASAPEEDATPTP